MRLAKRGKTLDLTLEIDWGRHVEHKIDQGELQDQLVKVVDNKILPTIAKGLSPVKSWRMFRKYKNPDNYPAHLKQSNKPNLNLTGEMLDYYTVRRTPKKLEFMVGISPDAPGDVKIRAKANNEGTEVDGKGVPARRFIPLQGESFTSEIVLAIREAFAKVMSDALKRKG
jgi:hypothetical protein